MSNFSIRKALPNDCSAILNLIQELAAYEREPEAAVASEQMIHDSLFADQAHCHAVIAEQDQTVVGFALFFFNFSTWLGRSGLYLEDLYVKPQCRGYGIGFALLKHLAQVAVERNCGRMEWSVLNWNEPAIKFYQSLGAQAMDGWTVYRLAGDGIRQLAES